MLDEPFLTGKVQDRRRTQIGENNQEPYRLLHRERHERRGDFEETHQKEVPTAGAKKVMAIVKELPWKLCNPHGHGLPEVEAELDPQTRLSMKMSQAKIQELAHRPFEESLVESKSDLPGVIALVLSFQQDEIAKGLRPPGDPRT
jgi:hypothetical protein